MTEAWASLTGLLDAYKAHDPRLDIWHRYPDITPQEDAYTDTWACDQVSAEFAEFARSQGWEAVIVHAEEAKKPFADYHIWVRLTRPGVTADVDWTARQYHNLDAVEGHDPVVLNQPWPLIWSPKVWGDEHPLAGEFDKVRHIRKEEADGN